MFARLERIHLHTAAKACEETQVRALVPLGADVNAIHKIALLPVAVEMENGTSAQPTM